MRQQKIISLFVVFFSLLFYFSCRKPDSEIPIPERPISIERFFNLPAAADARLKAIAQSIRIQEKDKPFLKNFIKRAGWPVWDKSKIISPRNLSNGRSTNGDSSSLVYIPIVIDSAVTVNAVLAVNMEVADTSWRILYANNYRAFGFDTTTASSWNARNVFQFFALFDYDIFGHTRFLIKDQRLFNTPRDSFIITLKERNGVPINGRMNRTESYVEVCSTWEGCVPPPQYPFAPRTSSINSDCFELEICNTYYWDDGLGGTDWTGSSWSGDGSGGGSNGGWGTVTTCTNTATGTLVACPPGWEPVDVDANGYYLERIAQLQVLLDQDPYFLIPCQYLSQFQNIGAFQAPQQVKDRLNNLNDAYGTWFAQNGFAPPIGPQFNLQTLDNATGTVVNCDYFPIHITILPIINGVQWTPQQLFEYFKNNINSVINTSIAAFEPYQDPVVNDENLWNSPNPFTALLHLNMINDGTVIVSDYGITNNLAKMKVSTISSPLDISHPVSGTREWGIQTDPNGGFFFYTTAVDRITDKFTEIVDNIITSLGGQSGFSQADELWRSLQNKMIEFVNSNNGHASLYSNLYVIARPDYSAVRDFLLKNIDLQTMRQRIGC